MTTTYKVLCVIISLALVCCIVFSSVAFTKQKFNGRYSAVSTISEESRQWLLERFGHCRTVPELLSAIDAFGCRNFVYDLYPMPLIQTFDLDAFIFEDNLHGICFEFSCFVKCAVLVWSEYHQRSDVQVFVYDVRQPNNGRHSYNFIVEDGHTWFFCLTTNVSRTAGGLRTLGFKEVKGCSIREYITSYDEKPYNVH